MVPTATALRTADFSGPELTAADDEDEADSADEDEMYRLPSWFQDEDAEVVPFDDELALGEEDITINSFEDFNDFNDFQDDFDDDFGDDFTTLPRRSSSSPRPTLPSAPPA